MHNCQMHKHTNTKSQMHKCTNAKFQMPNAKLLPLQAMVKIPSGTRKRWAEVAEWMVKIGKCERRKPKECVARAEKMKKDELLKRAAAKKGP